VSSPQNQPGRDWGTDTDTVDENTVEDGTAEFRVDDLAVDPRTDAEALTLCALLWAPQATAATITTALVETDFYDQRYGALFALIGAHVAAGTPHDPASIAATITANGAGPDHHGTRLLRALTDVTIAGVAPETAPHYALAVARAAYRRGYTHAATAMAQGAAELPEAYLFDHLLTIGRERRAATTRLAQLRTALGS
jgi:hypothetical protein